MSFEAAKRLQDTADRLEAIIAKRFDERKQSGVDLSEDELNKLSELVEELDVVVTSYEELLRHEIE